jgi:hypothetical protein
MHRDRRRRPRRRRLLRAGGALIVLGACAAGAIGVAELAAAGRPGADVDPFTATPMRAFLRGRAGNISAALYNVRTGATFLYRPGVREQTASIVKVDILATLLREAQDHDASLSGEEQYLAAGMIEQSSDLDATTLWGRQRDRRIRPEHRDDPNHTGPSGLLGRDADDGARSNPPAAGHRATQRRSALQLARLSALPDGERHPIR